MAHGGGPGDDGGGDGGDGKCGGSSGSGADGGDGGYAGGGSGGGGDGVMVQYRTIGLVMAAALMVASGNDDSVRDVIRSFNSASAVAVLDMSVALTLRRAPIRASLSARALREIRRCSSSRPQSPTF